jgi:hypothetical protein
LPGSRLSAAPDKSHSETHLIKDIGAIRIWYTFDGETPSNAAVYLVVNDRFPKLTPTNLVERLAWDRERFSALVKAVEHHGVPLIAKAPGFVALRLTQSPDPPMPSPAIADPPTSRGWLLLGGSLLIAMTLLAFWAFSRRRAAGKASQ